MPGKAGSSGSGQDEQPQQTAITSLKGNQEDVINWFNTAKVQADKDNQRRAMITVQPPLSQKLDAVFVQAYMHDDLLVIEYLRVGYEGKQAEPVYTQRKIPFSAAATVKINGKYSIELAGWRFDFLLKKGNRQA